MVIREAKIDELDEIMEFYDAMCRELSGAKFLRGEYKGGFPPRAMAEAAAREGGLFVGEEDGEIIAAYIMNNECDEAYDAAPWQIDADKKSVSVLHALRVSPRYGGRGYAGRLVEHAAETARARGQKALRLDCIEGNVIPQKMYLSHGFKNAGTVEIFYEDIGEPRKFLLFERVL